MQRHFVTQSNRSLSTPLIHAAVLDLFVIVSLIYDNVEETNSTFCLTKTIPWIGTSINQFNQLDSGQYQLTVVGFERHVDGHNCRILELSYP